MWYFIRKPIPLMPLTAIGIFHIKTKMRIITAEFKLFKLISFLSPGLQSHGLGSFAEA